MTWEKLADLLNTSTGYHFVRIDFSDNQLAPWIVYDRGGVMGAVYHEGLFNLKLAWEARFEPHVGMWFWTRPPTEDGKPVEIIAGDVMDMLPHKDPNGAINLHRHIWDGEMTVNAISPRLAQTGEKIAPRVGTKTVIMETNAWIIPPNFQGFPFPMDQIRNVADARK